MPRTPKQTKREAPAAPVPAEILDQFVRQGPISHEELEAAVRRFKNHRARLGRRAHASSGLSARCDQAR